jgi:gliding motility-associated-like protein
LIEQGITVIIEYRVCNTSVNPEVCPTAKVFITINPLDSSVIPEGFSSNEDGNNEVFAIENSEVTYPNSSIEIVNRWGNIVYKYTHNIYSSTSPQWWGGYSNGRMT